MDVELKVAPITVTLKVVQHSTTLAVAEPQTASLDVADTPAETVACRPIAVSLTVEG